VRPTPARSARWERGRPRSAASSRIRKATRR
jgi:hypothetical protein